MSLDRIGPHGLDMTVEAKAGGMCRAGRADEDPGSAGLSCSFHLIREGRDRVVARGVLRARVTQICVISLDEFDASLEEVFQVRFVPSGEEIGRD